MAAESLPKYSVSELNDSIGKLLERGFAPRFVVEGTASKAQTKKGHLWLTLTDGEASITAVVWSSKLKQLSFHPNEGNGVIVIGKINFWTTRATLTVQVIDIRQSLSAILREFEIVRSTLIKEGVINPEKRRELPKFPKSIAILTSSPSSALADMLRMSKEQWPLTKLIVIPIPVQGQVTKQIRSVLKKLSINHKKLGIEGIVLARGGGSREDLMVFDNDSLCRDLANFPTPVITGLGHEDDITVADLVADYSASTPTAAIVALLPNREASKIQLQQKKQDLESHCRLLINKERQKLTEARRIIKNQDPITKLKAKRNNLEQKLDLLEAFSPERWLKRGFAIIKNDLGESIKSIYQLSKSDNLNIQISDGQIIANVDAIKPAKDSE